MAATVKIGGDARELIRQIQALQKELDKLKNQGFKENTKASRDLERAGKKAFDSTRTAAEKYRITQQKLLAAVKAGKISLDTYNRSISLAAQELGDASKESDRFGETLRGQLKGVAVSIASVSTAVAIVREAYQGWLEDTRAIADQTAKTSDEILAFAALQEEGTIGERARLAVQAGAGVATQGEAFNLVQAMQSALGSFEEGLEAASDVFDAARVGIPTAVGTELATQAVAQGQAPEDFLRFAFAAGQASARDPEIVGLAAPALQQFDDKEFGFAVAGQLAGQFGRQVDVFTRAAGRALAETSTLSETFEKLGLDEKATPQQRALALSAAGIDTAPELRQAGLTEDREIRALTNLIQAIGAGRFQDIQAGISERVADEDLLRTRRAAIEAELPQVAIRQQTAAAAAEFELERSFDVGAARRAQQETERALQIQAAGRTTGFFGANVTEREGRVEVNRFRILGDSVIQNLPIIAETLTAIEAVSGKPTVPQVEAGAQ